MGYAFDVKVFGKIVEFSLIEKEATIMDTNGKFHKSKEVIVLRKIGKLNGEEVYDRDVIQESDFKYEIQLLKNGMLRVYALDDKLNRIGTPFQIEKDKLLNSEIMLVGNIFELRDKLPKIDFNIKVVKDYDGTNYTYFYACNNKEKKQIDLIKVLFLDGKILKGEDYQRVTLPYDAYLESIFGGTLKEVSEQELSNYFLSMSHEAKRSNMAGELQEDYFEDYKDFGVGSGMSDMDTEDEW